jgi:hypothetical protein
MKGLFIAFALLLSSQVFAAELNLSGGESAVINANAETKVTCGVGGGHGGSGMCRQVAEAFRATLAACEKSHSGGYCASTYWAKLKKDNPSCKYSGVSACIEYCSKSHSSGYCASQCD